MIILTCVFLFILYVFGMFLFFYFTGNLFSLGFKKPKPDRVEFTEADKKALEEFRARRIDQGK